MATWYFRRSQRILVTKNDINPLADFWKPQKGLDKVINVYPDFKSFGHSIFHYEKFIEIGNNFL